MKNKKERIKGIIKRREQRKRARKEQKRKMDGYEDWY